MWKIMKIGDLCKITSGGTPSRKIKEYHDNGTIKWFKTGDLKVKYLESVSESECITEEGLNNSSAKLFPPDTVLIAMYGATIGACSILKVEATTNQACGALLPTKHFIPEYMYYYIHFKKEDIISKGVGGAQPNISGEILKNIEIPLPPLETQKKIVKVLDKAQELIDARKEQIRLLDDLIQSVFYDMFGDPVTNPKGWKVRKLQDLLSFEPQNGMYKPQSSYVNDNTETPILRIDAFYKGKVTNWNLKRLICSEEEKVKYGLEVGDIVINRVNSIEYLGKCALIDKLDEPTVYESNMMRFTPNQEIIQSIYLTKLLSHDYIYNQILVRAKMAVNQASINQKDVMSFNILVPDIKIQKEFSKKIMSIEAQKETMQQSLNELQNNFNSLMQRAFKGELFT